MLAEKKQEWYEGDNAVQFSTAVAPERVLVPQPHTLDFGLRARCMSVAILIAVAAIFFTFQSEAIIRAGYDLVQLKAQVARVEKENEALRLDIARLKSPQRIQQIAAKELGMVLPQGVYCALNTEKTGAQTTAQQEKSVVQQITDLVSSKKVEARNGQ